MLGPIDTIRVFTTDLPKAIAFYRDALEMKLAISDETMAIFANGETKLMLEAIDPQDEDEAMELVGRLTGISFAVADIRAAYAALSDKKVRFDGRPELQPWGGALAYFFDTDDNILTLIQYPLPD
jgi:catechol 2,3-dioxygenase-like lactoylglutathione lyase family enzyme